MPLGLLWLGLSLLGALHTQAQDSTPNLIPAPPLFRVPLQPNFQPDQFQGKWYIVGLAGNAFKKEKQGQFKMYATTYELKEDRSYNVTSALLRDERCDHWIRTFVPSSRPGQFTLGNIKGFPGVQSYTVRVATTNYNQFAIVYFKKVYKNQEYFKTTLYGASCLSAPIALLSAFARLGAQLSPPAQTPVTGESPETLLMALPTSCSPKPHLAC
ncbi:neutrophil gelatinase-associated lipocalin isoform X2 [Pseudorca crassidens]|uniref:neutrophil gelatinase-associated lipocalin isoform X2 n=1 Tax=Pseudorca crassidens TaxID=82174 RepID=UPI00352C6891